MPASPASAHCDGHGTHPDLYSAGGISFKNGSHIKFYPHIDCGTNGYGYPSHGIDVHCYTYTNAYWYFVRNTTTGYNGWVREDALDFSQSGWVANCANAAVTHQAG